MRNINLVPKIPRVTRFFLPILLNLGGLSLLAAGSLYAYDAHLQQRIADKAVDSAHLTASVQALVLQRKPDPVTTDYGRLAQQVKQLQAGRGDWLPVMDLIASSMPRLARLTAVSVLPPTAASLAASPTAGAGAGNPAQSTGTSLKVTGEFADLTQAAVYMERLQQSSLLARVFIESVERKEETIPTTPAVTPPAPVVTETNQAASRESFIRVKEQELKPASTEGERLLNELQWMVTKQMAGQQFGLALPDKPSTGQGAASSPSVLDGLDPQSAIKPDDIAKAKQQYEQFKRQQPGSTGSGGSTGGSLSATGNGAAAGSALPTAGDASASVSSGNGSAVSAGPKITKYVLVLTVELKPQQQVK